VTTTRSAPPRARRQPARQRGDRIFAGSARAAGLLIVVVLAGVAAFLVWKSLPAFGAPAAQLPAGKGLWSYIGPLAFGSVLAAVIALVIATPLGVAIALFVNFYAPRRLARALGYVVDLLAAGWSHGQILASYPHLSEEDIRACLAYAVNLLREEKVYPLKTA